jgi:catechol 2,3-dioxygenase-like lactoylglutathione lyase family enzyme
VETGFPKRSCSNKKLEQDADPVITHPALAPGRGLDEGSEGGSVAADDDDRPMTITLNHTIVPARDKAAAAKFFAHIFGLKRGRAGYFAPVRINKSLTLLFDDDSKFESHHLAFHVSNREFDAIFSRIKKAKITFGSAPWSLDDGKLNDWGGGRGLYFRDPDGHVLEIMTAPQ